MHTVFVTGCGSGFGHAIARRLLTEGHKVVATDPDALGWPQALGEPHPNLLCLPLDLRDPDAVLRAVERADAWSPVDALVNNGGYAVFGTQEECGLDAVRDMFEVNVFGTARVTRALLPRLRERSGTVVQISSISGRTVFPESGFYAASKYALEAMTEALFQETCTFGVRVRLVQPGNFATRFQERAAAASPPPPPDSPYDGLRPLWDERRDAVLEEPQDPRLVAEAVARALAAPEPFLRIPVGPDAEHIIGLRDALGPDAWSRFAADRVGLDAPHRPGDVLAVGEVLALWDRPDADPPEDVARGLGPTAAAARHGHLGHWKESLEGQRALRVLARLA